MTTMHVGLDDTDSPRKGCTTYVASLIVEKLSALGAAFVDYPNLVRLNPNVPWKTRGNGALCLRFQCEEKHFDKIEAMAMDIAERESDIDHAGTDPGLVFFAGEAIPDQLKAFGRQAVQGIVKMKDALKLVKILKAEAFGFKTGRGIIGALASIGETLTEDHTYELIAYRASERRGMPRQIDASSVSSMNDATTPFTYNNVDPETGRVLITPHGPDPILYGIRGHTAAAVKHAHNMIRCSEPIERWTIFRTNQGTDAHLREVTSIKDVHSFNPVVVKARVVKEPWTVPRRHVIFTVGDETGQIDCAAYEPTGELRKAARQLLINDIIKAYGGVRPPSKTRSMTINLEKMRILDLTRKAVSQNPLCPQCSRRMKSMGAGQGFRCEKCGFRSSQLKKAIVPEKRKLQKKLYVTSPRSQRHLTKPLCRYGLERSGRPKAMIRDWFWISGKD